MESSRAGAVLFDLDGVLVDSRAAITGCINHALLSYGSRPRATEALLKFIGPPLAGAFAELTGPARDSVVVDPCIEAYGAEVSLRETTVVPGIVRVLGRLRQRHRLGVAPERAWRWRTRATASGARPPRV
jgi:phosphoglycolate phosphatase